MLRGIETRVSFDVFRKVRRAEPPRGSCCLVPDTSVASIPCAPRHAADPPTLPSYTPNARCRSSNPLRCAPILWYFGLVIHYSHRSAFIGLLRSTLAVGMRTAKRPTDASTRITNAKVGTLIGSTPNRRLESSGASANEKPRPTTTPAAIGRRPVSEASLKMWVVFAPSAILIPISRVRRLTALAVTP